VKYKLHVREWLVYYFSLSESCRKMVIGVKHDAYIVYITHQANIIEFDSLIKENNLIIHTVDDTGINVLYDKCFLLVSCRFGDL
jgi:hypothetical protein